MNTKLTLKNFRVFDNKQGGTFNLAPITILTGCNSSGKSSLVKALLLLKDFFQELATNKINDCKLDFGNTQAKLGRYDLALNNKSRKNGKMCFAYTVYSKELGEDLQVELWFAADSNDKLNNGWLNRFVISKLSDKAIIMDANISKTDWNPDYDTCANMTINKCDLRPIVKNFTKVVYFDVLSERMSCCDLMSVDARKKVIDNVNDVYTKKLSRILSNDEKDWLFKRLNSSVLRCESIDYISDYSWKLYVDLSLPNILFPLPILFLLKGVSKDNVRKHILALLAEREGEFRYNEALELVLSEFEKSSYKNFLDYYRAKEKSGLNFGSFECEITDVAQGIGKPKFAHKINSFSSMLNLTKNRLIFGLEGDEYIEKFIGSRFYEIYSVMIELSKFIDREATKQYIDEHWEPNCYDYEEHKVFTDLCKYFDKIVSKALLPLQFKGFQYVGDSAVEIKRIYTLESNDDIGQLLTRYCESLKVGEGGSRTPNFLNKWVKAFGIGDRVSVDYVSEGYGISVRIFKDAKDTTGRLLADEGLGITKLITIMINIELVRVLKSLRVDKWTCGRNRGGKGYTLAIEEPENHLHPRYQSLLAEMFADAYKNYGIHFIVETHSEYMVRKLQTLVAKKELTPDEVSLQYLYSPDIEQRPKGEPQVKNIPIREDGILKEPFGPGFLDEADNLAMDILTIKAMS